MLIKNNILTLSVGAKNQLAFWFFWVSRLRVFAVGVWFLLFVFVLGLVWVRFGFGVCGAFGLGAFVRGLFVGGML